MGLIYLDCAAAQVSGEHRAPRRGSPFGTGRFWPIVTLVPQRDVSHRGASPVLHRDKIEPVRAGQSLDSRH